MADLLTKIKRRILRPLYIDLDQSYKNTVFLAGTGRSGTTWVSNIINYNNEYRYMFEPFHPEKVRTSRLFGHRQYLRPHNNEKKYLSAAQEILSGKIRNFWIDNFNEKIMCTKRLVKEIRTNLLLRWIKEHFSEIPIILLLRHPCATASSQVKFKLRANLEDFLAQDDLMEDFMNPFKKEIKSAFNNGSDFEKHIFIWCIENYVPLKQFKSNEIHLAFYENFCEKPEEEIKKLFAFLRKDFDEKVYKDLKKPSPVSRNWSEKIKSGENLIDNWKSNVTDAQIQRAKEITNLFGLDGIYPNGSIPVAENAYGIMREI